jgi:hypothetical protein
VVGTQQQQLYWTATLCIAAAVPAGRSHPAGGGGTVVLATAALLLLFGMVALVEHLVIGEVAVDRSNHLVSERAVGQRFKCGTALCVLHVFGVSVLLAF